MDTHGNNSFESNTYKEEDLGVAPETVAGLSEAPLRSGPSDQASPIPNAGKTMLEVGDELISRGGWGSDVLTSYKIDRVTATMAFSGSTKYKRELVNGWSSKGLEAKLIGESYKYHELATPELKRQQAEGRRRRVAEQACHKINFRDLTTEQLEQIAAIADAKATTPNT